MALELEADPSVYANPQIQFFIRKDGLYYRWYMPGDKPIRKWQKINLETLAKSGERSPMALMIPGIAK